MCCSNHDKATISLRLRRIVVAEENSISAVQTQIAPLLAEILGSETNSKQHLIVAHGPTQSIAGGTRDWRHRSSSDPQKREALVLDVVRILVLFNCLNL